MGESHIEGPCVYWIGSNVRILGQSWQVEWGRGSRRAAAHPDSSYVCVHALKLSGASSFSPAAPPHSSSLSEAGDPAGTLLNTAAPRHSLVSPTWDRKKRVNLFWCLKNATSGLFKYLEKVPQCTRITVTLLTGPQKKGVKEITYRIYILWL